MTESGLQYYEWGFLVNVDGQVYWSGVWVSGSQANDPNFIGTVEEALQELLENDDPGQGLEGIAEADPAGDDYGGPSDYGDPGGYGDYGDGALAGDYGDYGDYGDFGDFGDDGGGMLAGGDGGEFGDSA